MSFGTNFFGKAYFGQGPAPVIVYIVKTFSASSTTVATISGKVIKTTSVSASSTTVAVIVKQPQRTISASSTTKGFISGLLVKALNIRRAVTKFLSYSRETKFLNGARVTKPLNRDRTTKDTQTS